MMLCLEANGSDWDIGDQPQNSLGVSAGYGDELIKGIDLVLALPFMAELRADYAQSDLEVGNDTQSFDRYYVSISSDPLANWSLSADYTYSGNDDTLETKDLGVAVQYYPGKWLLKARYLEGDTEIFPRQEAIDFGLVRRTSVEMERDATELTFQYFYNNWVWTVTGSNYSYSSRFNVDPSTPRTRLILGDASLQQLFGLLDWYASLEAGYSKGNHLWQLGYASYELELSGDEGKSPYAFWGYSLNETLSVGILGALGLDDSDHYGEISLRFHF
ncbi:MAG: hypothetical protein AB8B81_07790 [Halioglobus sp.]